MGFQYPPFQNPQKTHQLEESTTSCAQYDPVEVIAGLRCAPLETRTKKTPRNSNKTAIKKHLRACCLCSSAWKTPSDVSLFQWNFSQKVKQSKSFRRFDFFDFSIFWLFDFFDFFDFSFFRANKNPELQTFRVFDFSRSKIVGFTVWPLPARRAHSPN